MVLHLQASNIAVVLGFAVASIASTRNLREPFYPMQIVCLTTKDECQYVPRMSRFENLIPYITVTLGIHSRDETDYYGLYKRLLLTNIIYTPQTLELLIAW